MKLQTWKLIRLRAKSNTNDEKEKTIATNFHEKNITCKIQNFYILLAFLLSTLALLIVVRIYCYLMINRAKKHLLPFQVTNNELKEIIY